MRLFDRTSRSVKLTSVGKAFQPAARARRSIRPNAR